MNINLDKLNTVHMIGIGGISMSGIARILRKWNIKVTGSNNVESDETLRLKNEGFSVFIGTNTELVQNKDVVVYTGAIKMDNEELVEAKALGIPTMERAEFLGLITKKYSDTICVSGTHGKTTTTSMLSLCFLEEGKTNKDMDPTIQVGAHLKQIDGNYNIGSGKVMVLEACEYLESYLKFFPKAEIILNIDNDHLDYFKTFENVKKSFGNFIKLLPSKGYLVLNYDDETCYKFAEENRDKLNVYTFSLKNENANFVAKNIKFNDMGYATFDVYFNKEYYDKRNTI